MKDQPSYPGSDDDRSLLLIVCALTAGTFLAGVAHAFCCY